MNISKLTCHRDTQLVNKLLGIAAIAVLSLGLSNCFLFKQYQAKAVESDLTSEKLQVEIAKAEISEDADNARDTKATESVAALKQQNQQLRNSIRDIQNALTTDGYGDSCNIRLADARLLVQAVDKANGDDRVSGSTTIAYDEASPATEITFTEVIRSYTELAESCGTTRNDYIALIDWLKINWNEND